VFEIGNSLREARLRRGIEFAQAEQATKIRGKYLRALEEERFEQLPSETYIKGFLRTYAEYLGLDGQLYVDEYNSRFVVGDDYDRPRRSSARPQRRSRRLERNIVVAVALAAVAITTVILISAWNSGSNDKQTNKTPRTHRVVHKKAVTAPAAYLTITALAGRSSYVAIHRDGPAGRVLFNGTVRAGAPAELNGKHLWITVSSPENLTIEVGGHRVTLRGGSPKTFTVTPAGWRLD
jgi:cytoskeletal protein RodZ